VWEEPRDGWVKIYSDVAVTDDGGCAACDGIVGNSDGSFMFWFSSNLGASSVVLEEL
jgi:hypothetical protein